MISEQELKNWFTYHSPSEDQQKRYAMIREAAHSLAFIIINETPTSADQSAAIRKLRECVMTANAAIACNGR